MKSIALMFGFQNVGEVLASTFKPYLTIREMPVILSIGTLITQIYLNTQYHSGLTIGVFSAFIVMNIIEWITGVAASLKEGHSFSSFKLGRALLKTFIYIVMIVCLNQFRLMEGEGDQWKLITYSYWSIITWVILILTRSVIENLHRLGVKEAETIYIVLNNKYTRVFAILFAPPAPTEPAKDA